MDLSTLIVNYMNYCKNIPQIAKQSKINLKFIKLLLVVKEICETTGLPDKSVRMTFRE